jgi:hypothetical protein
MGAAFNGVAVQPVRSQAFVRFPFLIGIAILLMTAALALPVKQRCPQG